MKPKKNSYKGFIPSKDSQIEKVDTLRIHPEWFFENYVAKRKPCILMSSIVLDDSNIGEWKNINYLKKTAGETRIQIESKHNGQFGSSKSRKDTTFSEFLSMIEAGKEDVYLTTQYNNGELAENEQIAYDYCQPPLTKLIHDFPKRPKVLPTLVPQQVNLWMGASSSRNGTSSGLHHDFADNLYVLISGKKKFTCFPPSDAPNMYTYGSIKKIHENGMIAYKGSEVRSDGAYIGDVLQYKLNNLEQKLAVAEQGQDTEEIQYAVVAVEEAMENLLDYEMKQHLNVPVSTDPPSFSKIPTKELMVDTGRFPLLKSAHRLTFILEAGEMLYLPAGWFHEVTSFSEQGSSTSYHMAMNYWFHPPTRPLFEFPYEDNFWSEKWKDIESAIGHVLSDNDGTSDHVPPTKKAKCNYKSGTKTKSGRWTVSDMVVS